MKKIKNLPFETAVFLLTIFLFLVPFQHGDPQNEKASLADALVSRLKDWKPTEKPLNFLPETLFEYINGAAEIYLAYDFRLLTAVQFGREGSPVNLSVEIYEMSSPANAFGIYSAERFPNNTFIPVGVQGYIEEGALNFLTGRHYVKLICFEGEGKCEDFLMLAAKTIEEIAGGGQELPLPLKHFPRNGLVANSEKFILKNVMGYSFIHDGYFASYETEGLEFDCFLIVGKNEEDAREMLAGYQEAKKDQPILSISEGILVKDRYYKNIFLARVGNTICGVMKIEDGKEDLGAEYLKALKLSLKE